VEAWQVLKLATAVTAIVGAIVRMSNRRAKKPEYNGEPVTGPSLGRQIVGEPCAQCEKSIMMVGEGKVCKKCKLPVHLNCQRDHREVHQRKKQPYRGIQSDR
jgi:hypothetical protein